MLESKKPSELNYAVVAGVKGTGIVLWARGEAIENELENVGHDIYELDLEDPPDGMHVWEGRWFPEAESFEMPHIINYNPHGEYRELTEEEWTAIRTGSNPWP